MRAAHSGQRDYRPGLARGLQSCGQRLRGGAIFDRTDAHAEHRLAAAADLRHERLEAAPPQLTRQPVRRTAGTEAADLDGEAFGRRRGRRWRRRGRPRAHRRHRRCGGTRRGTGTRVRPDSRRTGRRRRRRSSARSCRSRGRRRSARSVAPHVLGPSGRFGRRHRCLVCCGFRRRRLAGIAEVDVVGAQRRAFGGRRRRRGARTRSTRSRRTRQQLRHEQHREQHEDHGTGQSVLQLGVQGGG